MAMGNFEVRSHSACFNQGAAGEALRRMDLNSSLDKLSTATERYCSHNSLVKYFVFISVGCFFTDLLHPLKHILVYLVIKRDFVGKKKKSLCYHMRVYFEVLISVL